MPTKSPDTTMITSESTAGTLVPMLEAGDFRYGEQITFDCPGKPLLTFESKTWAVDDGRPLALSSGFWRPTSATEVEVVLSVASGLVEILYGALVDGPSGVHVELNSDVIARTASAKEVCRRPVAGWISFGRASV